MPDRGDGEAVTGADWYGRDLSGQEHRGVTFVDLDLTEAENRGATFEECTFRRARFNLSAHTGAALRLLAGLNTSTSR